MTEVGVIGSRGDLGLQLTARLRAAGLAVDESDPRIGTDSPSWEEVMERNSLVHIAAPLGRLGLRVARSIGPGSTVVLHDSVMATSLEYCNRFFGGEASVVHMLMNPAGTVVVAKGTARQAQVEEHFRMLGNNVKVMLPRNHDKLMGRTQGPLALMVHVLHDYLKECRENDLLTASGLDLLEALTSRDAQWTPETLRAILANPELESFIQDMLRALHDLRAAQIYSPSDGGARVTAQPR